MMRPSGLLLAGCLVLGGCGGAVGEKASDDAAAATKTSDGSTSSSTTSSDGSTTNPDGSTSLTKPPYAAAVGPVPEANWVNVTNNLSGMDSECGNAAPIFSSPWRDMLVTGVARHGLYASTDGAATWTAIGAGGPDKILNRMITIVFDPSHAETFWESGIYGWESPFTDGAFKTTDDGASFTGYLNMGKEQQSSNDTISIDFTDPDRKTMLSGGHEQGVSDAQGLFLSTDGQGNFDDIMTRLPAGLGFCTATLVIDAKTMLVGCSNSYKGQTPGIARSTDGGATWKLVSSTGGTLQPLLASDGTIYWAAAGGGMLRSTDQGATFTKVADGSKTGSVRPLELPDGRIVSVGNGAVVVSADQGVTWTTVTKAIPFQTNYLDYSPFRRAFYATHFDCTNNVPSDAHARFGWDYEAK